MRRITRWFLRPKLASLFALLLLMLLLRLSWGWWVDRQLKAQLAAIRARGEPIEPSDVVFESVPAADNAAPLYVQAMSARVKGVDSPRNSTMEYVAYPPYPPQWMKLAEASEKAHGQVFALARAARQRPRAQFRQTTFEGRRFGDLNNARALANVLADGAEYSHVTGDDVEALDRLLDVLQLARAIRTEDYLGSHMVATIIDAMACNSVLKIASGLSRSTELAPRVRKLITQLLDEDQFRTTLRRYLLNERIRHIQWYTTEPENRWAIAPLADRDLIRMLLNMHIMLDAIQCTDYPQAQQVLSRIDWPGNEPEMFLFGRYLDERIPRYSRWFSGDDTSHYFSYIDDYFSILAGKRLTAASLAVRLYRADHDKWPRSLNDLVPAYLPAIPSDPFRADGGPIGYVIAKHTPPLSGERPLLYFDPGGKDIPPKPEPLYGWYSNPFGVKGLPVRQYRDLTRFTPAPAPKPALLPKTIYDNPDETDAPGENPEERNRPQ